VEACADSNDLEDESDEASHHQSLKEEEEEATVVDGEIEEAVKEETEDVQQLLDSRLRGKRQRSAGVVYI
jgi:hypothetical protein